MEILVLLVVIVLLSVIFSNGDTNHIKSHGNIEYTKISDVKLLNSQVKEVFDYYKTMLLEKKMDMYDVLHDVGLRREYNNVKKIENQLEQNDEETYVFALSSSFLNYENTTDIILNPKEEVFFRTGLAAIDTVQKIAKNIFYSGIKVINGSIRVGGGQIYSKNVEGLKRYDAGELVVTNQRIIFKGTNKNKIISIGSILSVDNYEDNGVIITMSNRENPIVIRFLADKMFIYNKVHKVRFFNNDLNWFYKALEKVFYKRMMPKEVQEARKEADELNFLTARKTMLVEGLEVEQ